jgi:hypothetical protein
LSSRASALVSSICQAPPCRRRKRRERTAGDPSPRRAGGFDHFETEPHAAGEIAAVAVVTVVGDGREKLLDDVAVGAVDFADVKTASSERRHASTWLRMTRLMSSRSISIGTAAPGLNGIGLGA